jgi:hypothetical protein
VLLGLPPLEQLGEPLRPRLHDARVDDVSVAVELCVHDKAPLAERRVRGDVARILEIDGRPLAEPREQPELAGVEIELGALGQTPVDAPVVLAPGERRHDPLQLGQ